MRGIGVLWDGDKAGQRVGKCTWEKSFWVIEVKCEDVKVIGVLLCGDKADQRENLAIKEFN